MDFFREKNFEFRLVENVFSEDGKVNEGSVQEQFQIWKDQRKYADSDVVNEKGEPLKFPILEGAITGTDGVVRDVRRIKFLKNVEFQRLYPYFQRKTIFIRGVYVGNQEFLYAFSNVANRLIIQILGAAAKLGVNTKFILLRQDFNVEEKEPNKIYSISIVKEMSQSEIDSIKQIEGIKPSLIKRTEPSQILTNTNQMTQTIDKNKLLKIEPLIEFSGVKILDDDFLTGLEKLAIKELKSEIEKKGMRWQSFPMSDWSDLLVAHGFEPSKAMRSAKMICEGKL